MCGAYPEQPLTPMLKDAVRWNARIRYVNKVDFRQFRKTPPILDDDVYWVSEGGFHPKALSGVAETMMELSVQPDYLVMAAATGTSLAGLALGVARADKNTTVIGIPVLNNAAQIEADLKLLLPNNIQQPTIVRGFEFGGYAKSNAVLTHFIQDMADRFELPLEPIYSGKSFYATFELLKPRILQVGK